MTTIISRKTSTGAWRVLIDGRETSLLVDKDEAPQWGTRQEWSIGVIKGCDMYPDWIAYGRPGKAHALNAIKAIYDSLMEARLKELEKESR